LLVKEQFEIKKADIDDICFFICLLVIEDSVSLVN